MPLGLSIRGYAKRRKCTHRAVQKAIQTGRIRAAVLSDGSIDPDVADRLWRRHTDETKSSNTVSGDPRRRRDPAEPPQPARSRGTNGHDGTDPAGAGYTRWRGIRESYSAALERIAYQEKIGALVRAKDVRGVVLEAFMMAMTRIEGWATTLDELLAAAPDRPARRNLWKDEIRKLREDLARAGKVKLEEAQLNREGETAHADAQRG